jgi:alginate O-acetyltransferase complex protein AlgI
MIIFVPVLVLLGIAAGPLLAGVRQVSTRRVMGWLVVAALIMGVHFLLRDAGPVQRMVGICLVLLGGMKGLVYAEWARGKGLPTGRYLVFSLLWFGMNPGDFVRRSPNLSWKEDVGVGVVLMGVGTVVAWGVWVMEWRHILVMFIPMSLGFHFGALRVLKGGLRAAGFPVRTLFPNVLKARGIGDFWGRRWNVGYSQMMQRLVGRPIGNRAGAGVGVMAVFVGSGLLHELAITLPVQSGYGLPTLYFTLHGLLTLVEKRWGRSVGAVPALLAVALPVGWLFPHDFQTGVIEACLGVFRWL